MSNQGGCKSIVPALKDNIRKANAQMKLKIVKRYLEEDIPQACSEQKKKIEDPLTNEEKTTSFWLMQKMLKYLMLILP